MSPLVAYHATRRACCVSIGARGLLAGQPGPGRPFGVYVFREDDALDHPTFSRGNCLYWTRGGNRGTDIWQVAYVGPLMADHYVTNGMVLLESVRPDEVALVTQ